MQLDDHHDDDGNGFDIIKTRKLQLLRTAFWTREIHTDFKEKSRILIVRVHGAYTKKTNTNALIPGQMHHKMFSYDKSWLMPSNDRKSEISNHFSTLERSLCSWTKYQHSQNAQNHM